MKIESITVKKVRGLVDFSFTAKGKNVAVSGPNASGKSALVDAIDFLFTGKISRLVGKGTGDLNLKEHGKHVDADIGDAVVSAIVKLPDESQFTITRALAQLNRVSITPSETPELISALSAAENGYHVLSRRELLKFIAADQSTRAQEIQNLLNLEEIENLRKLLGAAQREAEQKCAQSEQEIVGAKRGISSTLEIAQFREDEVLNVVNELRLTLAGKAIGQEKLIDPKIDLYPPQQQGQSTINPDLIKQDILSVSFSGETEKQIIAVEKQIHALCLEVKNDSTLQKDLEQKNLIDQGLKVLGDAKQCPLCGASWEPANLKNHLTERHKNAVHAGEIQKKSNELANSISSKLRVLDITLPRLLETAKKLKDQDADDMLQKWIQNWRQWKEVLREPLDKFTGKIQDSIWVECGFTSERRNIFEKIEKIAKETSPQLSPEQHAWDMLTRFAENWKHLVKTKQDQELALSQKTKVSVLMQGFEKAREEVLGQLYKDIESDFVDNYKILHDHEKNFFNANIQPEGAGVVMKVEFYGRGSFPPHALHSEGHQDSMGLCLFLALMKKLSENKVGFTILDDVVMSVDADHRRPVCDLLKRKFSDRQFFITTHDKAWARQLVKTGVVSKENCLSFRGWTVESGPRWKSEDLWAHIKEDINNDDVPAAAARLRRELEEMFDELCVCLAAPIPYSGEAKYDCGELSSAAIGAFGRLIRCAKEVARQWNQTDILTKISEREEILNNAKQETKIDDWMINETVHYNSWLNASKYDFEPILNSFITLRDSFKCNKCDNFLYIEPRKNPGALRCYCGSINWNLNKPSGR